MEVSIKTELEPAALRQKALELGLLADKLERGKVPDLVLPEAESKKSNLLEVLTQIAPVPETPTGKGAAPEILYPTEGKELDPRGMPWDGRIHSSGKSKLQNGCWKNKKGVAVSLIARVEAEYGISGEPGVVTTPNPVAPASIAPAPPAPVAPAPPVPPAPPEPEIPAEPVMTEEANGITYTQYIESGWTEEQLINTGRMLPRETKLQETTVAWDQIQGLVQARVEAGKLNPGEIEQILTTYAPQGVSDLPGLAQHPELWSSAYSKFTEAWR